jgi:hypothetical protein
MTVDDIVVLGLENRNDRLGALGEIHCLGGACAFTGESGS